VSRKPLLHMSYHLVSPIMFIQFLFCLSVRRVSRKFAIQVRIFSPTKFGIAKGMLVIKQGIDKIQIPESMIKVERSSSADPMHAQVVLVITQIFPSENCYTMERFINDDMKNPTDKQKQKLNVLEDDIVFIKNVLIASGVSPVLLDQCK
jgi:hypothetical protein